MNNIVVFKKVSGIFSFFFRLLLTGSYILSTNFSGSQNYKNGNNLSQVSFLKNRRHIFEEHNVAIILRAFSKKKKQSLNDLELILISQNH